MLLLEEARIFYIPNHGRTTKGKSPAIKNIQTPSAVITFCLSIMPVIRSSKLIMPKTGGIICENTKAIEFTIGSLLKFLNKFQ